MKVNISHIDKDYYLKEELYNLLKKDDKIFDFIQNVCLDGLWFWDLEKPENEWMNPVFWKTLGYNPDEMPHNPSAWQDIINKDDLKLAIDNFNKHLSDENHPYDQIVRYRHKDGHIVWIRCKGNAIRNENGKPVRMLGIHNEITSFKNNELRYKSLIEGTNVGTWEWNVQTGATVFNERWAEIVGYTLEELAPISIETWMKLAHSDDLEESGKRLTACFEKKSEFYEFEARMKHKNGHWVWVYDRGKVFEWTEDGKPLWMYGTHQDISIRKEAEQLKNEVLERFELIGHHIPGAIYQFQLNPDGSSCFPYTSPGIESIYGVTSEQVSNDASSAFKVIHPDDLEKVSKTIQESANNLTPWTDIYRVILPSGDTKWLQGNATPQRKPDGSILWHGYIQDITDRKLKEETLRISEEAFRGNFENAAVGMAIISPKGQWLKVNQKVCEIVGYPEKELLNLTFQDITHPHDLHTDQALLNEVIEGKRSHYQMEKRYFHKKGYLVHIILAVSVVKDTEGEILYFISQIIDISKRKKQEEELNYQKNLLSSFYNLSPIGIALNDYDTGRFIDVNDKLIEPTGYTKKEFLSLSYWDVTPKEYENLEAIALQQMEDKGKYEMFEKEYIRKDGSRYPVSLQGVVVKDTEGKKLIWSLVRDISQEKEAERKLREAISNLQAVLDASKQVSIIAMDTEGQITLFNSGAEKMLGYKAEELVGKHTPAIIHLPEEVENESKALSEKYEKEIRGFETFVYEAKIGQPNTKEWSYKSKNEHIIPVLLSINKIETENTIIGYLGVATDITELKKIENEIRSLLSITEKQNDRLKNFAHIVSHNLRSHSGGISGLIELLQLEYPDLASNELLILLNMGAENLKQTVDDLTEIVKVNLTTDELQHIQLSKVIEKNIKSLSIQISRARIKILNEIPDTVKIQGIAAYVDSIVLNMITNAIKYKSEDRESFLRIYCEEDKTTLTLYFQDNGLGIDLKRHGDKLFGMYKTFHRHDDSRGVGLFITKNQLESMGGKISVESEINIGTTFKITLKK
ncbi:PAS domain S-box protein [Pedobacter alpinus]|uniref:histidine kinase n=1 Tax=Pedobacter alpinus TaxID=1590643 RepID=A0ABW5TUQ1_9SPHI